MNVVGIIAEYNPFHNGHAYHVAEAKKQSAARFVIACMSGNYTQRGEPALFDKWTRTRMALASGVDLVIEIPALYSLSSSEFYAEAGVRLLSHTGQVSHLSFGIEPVLPEKELLETLTRLVHAETDEADIFYQLIQKRSKEGHGYAVQRAAALHEMTGVSESLLQSPNLILALDYLKALYRLESSIVPVPVLRNGDYHTSDDAAAPSASVLREKFNSGASIETQVPPEVFAILQKTPAASSLDTWSDLLFDRALHLDAAQLSQMLDVSEGLESRILRILDHPIPVSEAVEAISTKRYPKARIRRILMNLLLEAPVRPDAARRDPGYLRILGFRKEAEPLLSAITEAADVPVITNLSRQMSSLPEDLQSLLRFEAKATDLYFAHVPDTHIRRGAELTQPIIVQ